MVKIVPYNSDWPAEFERLAAGLQAGLGELALRIDHIGSTAVPGLIAKDVIDIQVTVATFSPELMEALESMDYRVDPTIQQDHVPPGMTDDPREWEKIYARAPEGTRRTNTHIRIEGRMNQRYPLIFRDYLRTHPLMAEAYGRLKVKLAGICEETLTYADIKDPAVDLIWLAALEEYGKKRNRE